MHRRILLDSVAAFLIAGSVPAIVAGHAAPRTACELFTDAEVARFLAVPEVHIDSVNSGKNEMTGVDFCSYYVVERDPRGVMVKLRRVPSEDEAKAALIAARIDEEFAAREPEPVGDLGEEAQFLRYKDGQGSTIIVRQGSAVVTLTGSISKAICIEMAKLALPRL